jgi:hypothetical protein
VATQHKDPRPTVQMRTTFAIKPAAMPREVPAGTYYVTRDRDGYTLSGPIDASKRLRYPVPTRRWFALLDDGTIEAD